PVTMAIFPWRSIIGHILRSPRGRARRRPCPQHGGADPVRRRPATWFPPAMPDSASSTVERGTTIVGALAVGPVATGRRCLLSDTLAPTTRIDDLLKGFHRLFGVHRGLRPVHTRGVFLEGEFVPADPPAALSRAAFLRGAPTPVVARFSNFVGMPDGPDNAQ